MGENFNKPILIVDVLCGFSLVPLLTKFSLNRQVFYLHQGKGLLSRMMIQVLKIFGWSFMPIDYTLSSVGGVSLYRELSRIMIEKIKIFRENIFPRYINILSGISEYERERLSSCFGSFAGAELYFPMLLYLLSVHKFTLQYKIQAVLLKKTVFSAIVAETYRSGNLPLCFYPSFIRRKIFFRPGYEMDKIISRIIGSRIYSFIKMVAFICFSLVCKISLSLLVGKKIIKKHKICALVFNRYPSELISCLYWGSNEADYLREETLTLAPSYLPDSAKEFYKKRSDKFIEYNFSTFISKKDIELVKTWSCFINFFFKNIWIYRRLFGFTGIRGWMSKYLLEMLTYISFFESLFYVNGSKILWTTAQDYTFMQLATVAINRQGGISLSSTFSQSAFPEWEIQHNQIDVYFGWGRRSVQILKDNYDQCRFFVIAGYPTDRMFIHEFKKAQDFRNSIVSQYKVKNIITFIDNAPTNDTFISPQTLSELYNEIFSWLKEGQENFCIIKAKRSETINMYLGLKERLDEFCQRGQMLIFYEPAVVYPSWAADAVISPSLSLLCVSALSGRPCIYYDVHHFNDDYVLGLDNIQIISQANEIREAIERAIMESQRNAFPQRLEPVRGSVIDPFVDGKSIERIREYLTNLLDKLNGYSSNTESIEYANEQHRRRWGQDSVISGLLQVKS